jgi:hypothetical protein
MRRSGDTLCVTLGTDYLWITMAIHGWFVHN